MFILQGLNLIDLSKTVSAPRLKAYEMLTGTNDVQSNIGAYLWGLELTGAFGPLLAVLEVTLRNRIDHAATTSFRRADWIPLILRHAGDREWLNETLVNPQLATTKFRSTAQAHNKKTILVEGDTVKLGAWKSPAEQKYDQLLVSLSKKSIPAIPANIVANSMFGLWVDMIQPSFHGPQHTSLWRACEAAVFPGIGVIPLETIAEDLRAALAFRNRAFHHEPTWRFGPDMTPLKVETNLKALLRRIYRVIGALSPDMLHALNKAGIAARLDWLTSIAAINAFADKTVPASPGEDEVKGALEELLLGTEAGPYPPVSFQPHKSVSLAIHGKPAAIVVGMQ